ncbi:MAG: hypothetical protein LBC69_04705 [Eubacteriaceae bacterium]|jgi:hypothetical protein|nr:hypothetical protein [Eubacteriaceae bacterium]
MDRINLKNVAKPRGVDCSMEYEENSDSVQFYIKLKSRAPGEFALVFRKADNATYTAAIIASKPVTIPVKVERQKIASAVETELVNIETEEVVFTSDFALAQTTAAAPYPVQQAELSASSAPEMAPDPVQAPELSAAPDPVPANAPTVQDPPVAAVPVYEKRAPQEVSEMEAMKEFFQETEDAFASAAEEEKLSIEQRNAPQESDCPPETVIEPETTAIEDLAEQSAFSDNDLDDLFSQFELTEPQAVADFYENAAPPNEDGFLDEFEDEDAFFSAFESEISFTSDAADGAHIIDFTPYFDDDSPEEDASVKLINEDPYSLRQYFRPFGGFASPTRNREFYSMDDSLPGSEKLRVLLNGYNVPLATPFLEYKNVSVEGESLPKRLIGVLRADNSPEYFIFGCLGYNRPTDQPFMGATGFVYFEQMAQSSLGYWICYVNAKTGKISLPIKPKNYESEQ